ncbi:MAG: transporter substrate-binding domain-containing protein [Opitutales bacterium]|nr:transporter substrate-binding domain-containing protein [Opitutales bacterium]
MIIFKSTLRALSRSLGILFLIACVFGCTESPQETRILRVGTSGDYEPFSMLNDQGEFEGYDIVLAEQFAADNGYELKWVSFAWPDLISDLEAGKFDLAMSGVTIRKDRSLKAQFSVPLAMSGAVVIVPEGSVHNDIEEIDREGFRLAVNEGGHLERVTREHFSKASIVTTQDNQALPAMLLAGEVDALVTDTMEAPYWLERVKDAKALPPFTRDVKAALIHPDRSDLAGELNGWLLEQEANGNLGLWREEHLPTGNGTKTTSLISALLAAMVERLHLMVDVAESKRKTGKAIEDIEQEARVIQAAVKGVADLAEVNGQRALDPKLVEHFFCAQIEAAKAIQRHTMRQSPSMETTPDLVTEIRPALGRISARINQLICSLATTEGFDERRIRNQIQEALSAFDLPQNELQQVADAFIALALSTKPS